MRSHLILAAALPADAEGFPLGDCAIVRQLADGRLAIHAHESVEIPTDVEVIRDGHAAEWEWDGLAATHPALAAELLLVDVADPATGGTMRISQAEAAAAGAAILAGPFPPHYWTDDPQPSTE